MPQKLNALIAACSVVVLWSATSLMPAAAQSKPMPRYLAAVANAAKEIAKDPCNSSNKLAALASSIEAAAKLDKVGADALFMLERMASTGCANSALTLSRTELLLNAGRQSWVDTCAFSASRDYSAELAMSRTAYNPQFFKLAQDDLDRIPCAAAFIVAVLTNQDMTSHAGSGASPPGPAKPSPAEPATDAQQRRRQR
jgi:hypothetical protein